MSPILEFIMRFLAIVCEKSAAIQVLVTLFVRLSNALDNPCGWVLMVVAFLCIGYIFPALVCATYASVDGYMKIGCL